MIKLYEGNETYRVILQSTGQEFLLTEYELEELSYNVKLIDEVKDLEREIELWQDEYIKLDRYNDELEMEIFELSEKNDELENYKFMYEELQ